MNILAISSILPIPGILEENDFILHIYRYYIQQNKNDKIIIIKPVQYDFNPARLIRGKTRLSKLKKDNSRIIDNFQVEIIPFLSAKRFCNVHSLLTRSIYFLNRKRINSILSAHKFDIIHAQYIFPDGLLAKILHEKYSIPYFITTHNERFYFERSFSKKISLDILKKAKEVLPINHSNFIYYKSLGVKNIEIFPLGFNKNFLRNQKEVNLGKVSIFTVSKIIKLKNIDKVLRAVKKLVTEHNIRYTIIGTGPEKESLIRMANDLGINDFVTFIDYVPHEQVADEMYKHDIFIMPSFFETFGRVYFEVMAMGIPAICAKNSGIYGLFKEREEGISVQHDNITEIAESLRFLITNPEERQRIGRNGQLFVQAYTWENIAGNLHSKYLSASG